MKPRAPRTGRGLACFTIWLAPLLAGATTWYVAPDGQGSDAAHDGLSTNEPFATINHAAGVAAAGDTLRLLRGTHTQPYTLYLVKSLTLEGEDRAGSVVYFPTNFTTLQNVHGISINAHHVTLENLTVRRDNFLPFGATVELTGYELNYPNGPLHLDGIALRGVTIEGGSRGVLMNPGNARIDDCAIRGLDATSNFDYGQDALAFEITGFTGLVTIANTLIDGTLLGVLGGTRIHRAFLIEPRDGRELCRGTLELVSNIVYNVREPFLWDCYENPVTNKAAVHFLHNTLHVTEKTCFTLFTFGTGAAGLEYQKFNGVVVRDNLFAHIGGTSIVRCDYQYGPPGYPGFARNFPIGGFTFDHNLLYLDAPHGVADALGTPLATDPGWYGGSEFNVSGQSPDLRVDITNASPFLDPAHVNDNYTLDAATVAGQQALAGATDGKNLGAWATPAPEVALIPELPLQLSWSTVTHHTYQAQGTLDLAGGSWSNLGSAQVATSGVIKATVAGEATAVSYRVITLLP